MRYAARVEYNGWAFHGWQHQSDVSSVQDAVENALSRVADETIKVICAGRTDTGVHGVGQVIHFDTTAERPLKAWTMGSNTHLSPDVAIRFVKPIDPSFHARYSAVSRHYRYVIANTLERPALLHRRACWVHQKLDCDAMRIAAQFLLGEHDFSAFRASSCQAKSPVRRVSKVEVTSLDERVYIDVHANAFLHNMVRIVCGTLCKVGRAEADPTWVKELLDRGDRTAGGMTAPAGGLYFIGPTYPDMFNFPPPSTNGLP
ncbi:MAG: tRNA pseudouridine(38-40) synthase TruA [Pseudomonadota bacterium]